MEKWELTKGREEDIDRDKTMAGKTVGERWGVGRRYEMNGKGWCHRGVDSGVEGWGGDQGWDKLMLEHRDEGISNRYGV